MHSLYDAASATGLSLVGFEVAFFWSHLPMVLGTNRVSKAIFGTVFDKGGGKNQQRLF